MKHKKYYVLGVTGIAALGISLTLALGQNISAFNYINSPSRAKVPVDFVEETITRRVYFTNNDNYWSDKWTYNDMQDLYVYAWQLSDNTNHVTAPVTKLMSDYYPNANTGGCLYYADLSFAGVGDRIGAIVLTTDWHAQTIDVTLPAFWSESPDVIYLNSGTGVNNHRNASVGSITNMSSGQFGYLLSQYKTCDSSYADGYNAYPQIYKDFNAQAYLNDATQMSDYDYDEYVANGKSYEKLGQEENVTNISAKLSALEAMYESNGYTVSNPNVVLNFGSTDVYTCTNGKTNRITYESVTNNTYKNTYSSLVDVPSNSVGISLDFKNDGEELVEVEFGIGTSGEQFASHLVKRPTEYNEFAPYDYYNQDLRGKYIIGAGESRSLVFYFDRTNSFVFDGFMIFINSAWAEADNLHTDGDMTISNAVYLFD